MRNLATLLGVVVMAAGPEFASGQHSPSAHRVQPTPLVARLWGVETDIIGDADGSGAFDAADVVFVRNILRHGKVVRTRLADVARPCNGRLEPRDGQRLLGAIMEMRRGVDVRSRCHEQAIGTRWVDPAERKPPRLVTIDDQFARVARSAPGFGGLYIEDERLKVVLTDPGNEALEGALQAIGRVFGEDRFAGRGVEAVRGDYDFPSLKRWKELADPLLALGPVTLIDADERRNRLRLGITDESKRRAIEARLKRLDIPLEAVIIEIRPKARFSEHILIPMLQGKRRPLTAGAQISRQTGPNTMAACTLGFLAKWYGSARGFVTAGHCEQTPGVANGTVFFQPDPGDPNNNRVGREVVDYAFGCSWGDRCRQSDSTFMALDEGVTGRMGVVPRSTHVYPQGGSYTLIGKGTAVCGEQVTHVGAAGGERSGEVESTCVGFSFEGAQIGWPDQDFAFICQNRYDPAGKQGDSGGPVIKRINWSGDARLLGVHVGVHDTPTYTDSIYSPIANIEAELGPFDVANVNEPPEIEIISPPDGSKIGPGGMPAVDLQAKFFDFEGGIDCVTCEVRWFSSKDGNLGVTPVVAGLSGHNQVLGGGPGYRAIKATAVDAKGAETWDTVVVSTANSAPQVWIDWPEPAATLYKGFTYTFAGSSFDAENFQALPCKDLEWTSVSPQDSSFPVNGCFPAVSFDDPGIHFITLTGQDDLKESAKTTIAIWVADPPASGPPSVHFIAPPADHYLAPSAPATTTAVATDPEGQPVSYQWLLSGSGVAGQVPIGNTSGPSGAPSSHQWTPSDHALPGCGSESVSVTVIATDADGNVDAAQLPLSILYPPC